MSADRELIERAKSLAHTFDGEFATAPHTRRVSEVHLPAADMDRLLALASAGADANEATDEFNAGYECAKAGGKITDEPNHCPQDEWRNGFLCGDYDRHAAAARLAGVEAGLDAAAQRAEQDSANHTDEVSVHEAAVHFAAAVRRIDAAAVAARGRG